jgi:hypothetical protein
MLEIGGAKALEMPLIPILLHVGPNDLPQPLAKGLSRDLNDVDKYYAELKQRMAPATSSKPVSKRKASRARKPAADRSQAENRAMASARERRTFSVGDVVKIPEQPQPPFVTNRNQSVAWKDDMTTHAGKVATVTFVDDDRTVHLDVDPAKWWAMDWLEPA